MPESCRADDQDDNTDSTNTCSDLLLQADADGDGALTEPEYLGYLQLRFPDCAAYDAELTGGQQLAFASACAVGLLFGGNCDPPVWDLENSSGHLGYCTAAAGAALVDGCDDAIDTIVDDVDDVDVDIDVPTPVPLGRSDCVADLIAADANGDGSLDESEYLAYVRTIYDDRDYTNDCTPAGETQSATFQALACATCLFDNTCDTCGAAVDISAATATDEDGGGGFLNDLFERGPLVGICAAAESAAALECATATIELDVQFNTTVGDDVNLIGDYDDAIDDGTCFRALDASDGDRNSYLDRTEFAALVAELFPEEDGCELPTGDGDGVLSQSHSSTFNALACASCLVDAECGCDAADGAAGRISIAGAADGPDVFERIRLVVICASTRAATAVACGVDGVVEEPFPSPLPLLGEECIEDLVDADANRDGQLDEEEYLQLARTVYGTNTEYADCAPGDAQTSVFSALACATCLLDGACDVDTCGDSVDIAAAASPDGISFLERANLMGICAAALSTVTVDCALPGTVALEVDVDVDEGVCAQSLDAADADQNSFLDINEYATLAADLTDDDCELPAGGDGGGVLSPSHSASFNSLACASCLTDSECGCGGDMARISIAGAAGGATALENVQLSAICASTRTAAAAECLDGGGGEQQPTPAPGGPTEEGNSPTVAPATQAPVVETPPDDNDDPTASPATGATPTESPAAGATPTASPDTGTTASGRTSAPVSVSIPESQVSGSPTTTTIAGAVLLLVTGVQLLIS